MNLLFLHGYTQSGPLFSAKTKAVQKALTKSLGADTTLHFPTAPIKLSPADIPGDAVADDAADLEAYAWWRRATPTSAYTGLPETFLFISSYLDTHGPFDGVIGFSQGAAFAAILAAILEKGRKRPEEFTTSHPPLKFAVCYSGFRAPDMYREWYEPSIETKVLHVIGSLDTVVDEERSLELMKACVDGDKRTVYHPGGHYLPAQKPMVNALVGFILSSVKEEKKEEIVDDLLAMF
ncbi:serine hydrolase FSH [Tricharina praecox]|uniref:serine hydrolase FSH n=1 Tax=Tricharina praecox TaxID=43433 RepID=UPI0022211EDB|nr:serine hydrolase FSH [Tricharina praecox]KAI5845947.1 serine hydrolase FSH [Tricharina praecox]